MKIDVSIIVPVYNVENYLHRCVDSILEQTYSNFEIILVDDGSKDDSGNICDYYKQKDCRVKVIHKENGGLSDARNCGMKIAKGDYILFVDSDDYLDKFSIEKLFEKAKKFNLDIVEGKAYTVKKSTTIDDFVTYGIDEKRIYSGTEYAISRIKNHCFYAAVWLKMYKKELIEKNKLKFKDKRLHEDELWNPQAILNADRIMYIDYPFYYYDTSRDSSIMNNISQKNIESVMKNCYELADFYKSKNMKISSRNIFLNYVVKQYMMISTKCSNEIEWYKSKRNLNFVFKNIRSLSMFCVAVIYSLNINVFFYFFKKR